MKEIHHVETNQEVHRMSSPTVIYHATNDSSVTMIIDVGGEYYVQQYRVHSLGNLTLMVSEVWTDAMSAKHRAIDIA